MTQIPKNRSEFEGRNILFGYMLVNAEKAEILTFLQMMQLRMTSYKICAGTRA
jgi:hypothetical protein